MRTPTPTAALTALLVAALATRAHSSSPKVRYQLQASLDDQSGVVVGRMKIHYAHLSSDTLRWLTLALGYNSFRPGSYRWPRRGTADTAALGFVRISEVVVNGTRVAIEWPDAPDSSTARIVLPAALAGNDSVLVEMNWRARAPSLSWEMRRRGRRVELVGWYPLLLDETSHTPVLSPAVSTQLLELDVAADQVIGGTGVPLCGDPGWEGATTAEAVPLQRTWYSKPLDPTAGSVTCQGAAAGRKRIAWYAENVSALVYALSPNFRYEVGDFNSMPGARDTVRVHSLFEHGHQRVWGAGIAVRRTEAALAWTFEVGTAYPWPQVTVIEALGNNGSAEPMVLLADVSSQTALLNLLGLMISQQMLFGGDRIITVGTAAFQTTYFFETLGERGDYARLERQVLDWDLDGLARGNEPFGRPSSAAPCSSTSCFRTAFLQHQLRRWTADDSVFRNVYRKVIADYMFQPTPRNSFLGVAQTLIQPDPLPLYTQLSTGNALYDDAITSARRERMSDGRWRTVVVLERREKGLFPQTLWVIAETDTAVARATALTPHETFELFTNSEPQRVVLDPLVESHDWNMLNNQRVFPAKPGKLSFASQQPTMMVYIDRFFSRPSRRDRLTVGWAPTLWHNDAGGWTIGMRMREDYLGRFELNQGWLALSTRSERDLHGEFRLANPTWLRATGWSQQLRGAWLEGRAAAAIDLSHKTVGPFSDSTVRVLGIGMHWNSIYDVDYLDTGQYDDAGTAELVASATAKRHKGAWPFALNGALAGGYAYPNRDARIAHNGYAHVMLSAHVRGPAEHNWTVGARIFAAGVFARRDVPKQRRIYLAGSDAYEQLSNPFLRSRGALLRQADFYYNDPGGAGVRGVQADLSARRAAGATLEIERCWGRSPGKGLFRRFAIASFADGAFASDRLDWVADAGMGARADHQIGDTSFQTRVDVPFWVNKPVLAPQRAHGSELAWRWTFSFKPSF